MPIAPSPPPAVYATPPPAPDASRTSIDANITYDSNFADTIVDLDARYDLIAHGAVLPYANLLLGYDTRSAVPGLGEVYNENAVIPSFGLRAPFGENQYGELFVQGGYSFGLRGQPSFPETRWGLDYTRDYGTPFLSALPHAEVTADLIDYSRFAGNVIGTIEAFTDARMATSLRALVGADVSFDDHREYDNNYAEAYAGFMVPLTAVLDLRLTGVEGVYLARGIGRPSPDSYSAFRVMLSHSSPP